VESVTSVLLTNLPGITRDTDIKYIRVTGNLPWYSSMPFKKGWVSRLLTDLLTL
jgi:hypothetical protein